MMRKIGKLVRDRIPDELQSEGTAFETRILTDEEYRIELEKKLKEEVHEFLVNHSEEELADILEVVYALGMLQGISIEQLESIRNKKKQVKGEFKDRVYLVWVNK